MTSPTSKKRVVKHDGAAVVRWIRSYARRVFTNKVPGELFLDEYIVTESLLAQALEQSLVKPKKKK